jgi:hypothetical protein
MTSTESAGRATRAAHDVLTAARRRYATAATAEGALCLLEQFPTAVYAWVTVAYDQIGYDLRPSVDVVRVLDAVGAVLWDQEKHAPGTTIEPRAASAFADAEEQYPAGGWLAVPTTDIPAGAGDRPPVAAEDIRLVTIPDAVAATHPVRERQTRLTVDRMTVTFTGPAAPGADCIVVVSIDGRDVLGLDLLTDGGVDVGTWRPADDAWVRLAHIDMPASG